LIAFPLRASVLYINILHETIVVVVQDGSGPFAIIVGGIPLHIANLGIGE
jgi:hypothetical protein